MRNFLIEEIENRPIVIHRAEKVHGKIIPIRILFSVDLEFERCLLEFVF